MYIEQQKAIRSDDFLLPLQSTKIESLSSSSDLSSLMMKYIRCTLYIVFLVTWCLKIDGSDYVQSPRFPCSPSTAGNTIISALLQDYYIKPVPLPEYGVSSNLTVSSVTIEYQGTKILNTNYLRVMGVNLIVYQIYYNKVNITDYIHITDKYIIDYTFTLTRLSINNAGFYSIVVTFCSDTASKQVQATVELQLKSRINMIIAEPYSIAMDNSIAHLYCYISGYIPQYSDVIWSKDHYALTNALSRRVFFDVMPDINSVGQNGGSQTGPGVIVVMNIMSPTAGDMGTYGCHILGTSVSRYVDVYDIINPLPTKVTSTNIESTQTTNGTETTTTTGDNDDDDHNTVIFIISVVVIIFGVTLIIVICCFMTLYCLFGPPPMREKCYRCLLKLAPKDEEEIIRRFEVDFEKTRKEVEQEVATGFETNL